MFVLDGQVVQRQSAVRADRDDFASEKVGDRVDVGRAAAPPTSAAAGRVVGGVVRPPVAHGGDVPRKRSRPLAHARPYPRFQRGPPGFIAASPRPPPRRAAKSHWRARARRVELMCVQHAGVRVYVPAADLAGSQRSRRQRPRRWQLLTTH